jgi:hypothetical protein
MVRGCAITTIGMQSSWIVCGARWLVFGVSILHDNLLVHDATMLVLNNEVQAFAFNTLHFGVLNPTR